MALILHIDTASFNANICLAQEGYNLWYEEGENQKTIEFLHPAIQRIMNQTGYSFSSLDAVMVHAGPGSYTGLRIGFATAKGICYAVEKPFIAVSSFDILSHIYFQENPQQEQLLIIDNARADEWYFQYFENKKPIQEACIKTTDEVREFMNTHSASIVSLHQIEDNIFSKSIVAMPITTIEMMDLGEQLFKQKQFTDIYQSEPFYCKAAYVK